jgi:hypothetical protein
VLRLCIAELEKGDSKDEYTRKRLEEIYEFFTYIDVLYGDIRQFPVATLKGMVKARGAVRKFLSMKK